MRQTVEKTSDLDVIHPPIMAKMEVGNGGKSILIVKVFGIFVRRVRAQIEGCVFRAVIAIMREETEY